MTSRRFTVQVALCGLALTIVLSGCSSSAPITAPSDAAQSATNGAVTEIASSSRGKSIDVAGTLDSGIVVAPKQWIGRVIVVNFWYAGCAPCRAEAPILKTAYNEYQPKGVIFVGVNVRDQPATARAFENEFAVPYASFLDTNSGSLQLAFSGKVAPNAVPTTVVLDREGRVSARVLGQLESPSILGTLVADTLKEKL
jgi:thiol-disulfide isomerase/thioredoxin